jgi:hypothetical protein
MVKAGIVYAANAAPPRRVIALRRERFFSTLSDILTILFVAFFAQGFHLSRRYSTQMCKRLNWFVSVLSG